MTIDYNLTIHTLNKDLILIDKAIEEAKKNRKEQLTVDLLMQKNKLKRQLEILKEDYDEYLENKSFDTDDTTDVDMNVEQIDHFNLHENIPKLINAGGHNNYLVINIDSIKNYFIDISTAKGKRVLYCNAVSNYYLQKLYILSNEKIKILTNHGWDINNEQPMSSNHYHKIFLIENDDDLKSMIKQLIFLIENVYDTQFSKKIKMRFYLG